MTKAPPTGDLQNNTGTQSTGVTLGEIQSQALNNIIDQHAIVSMTDAAGIITYVNDKFCKISGYTRTELLGQNHRIIQSGKHSKQFFRDLWQTITQGRSWQGLVKNKNKDGSPYWVQTTIMPILDKKGKPQQYLSVRTDVSEQERSKRELQRFKQTLDQTLDCLFIFDAQTLRFNYVNKGAIEQTGYSEEELLNMAAFDINLEYEEVTFREMIAPLLNGAIRSQTFETFHEHKDGEWIPVEVFLQYFPDSIDSDTKFIAVVRDITERKRLISGLESLSVAEPGENVFLDIAHAVSESQQNRWVGIGRISPDDKIIETIAFWRDGQLVEQFSYPIAGTPCAEVYRSFHSVCVQEHLMERYSIPIHTELGKEGAMSYWGEPLLGQLGEVMGVLWAIDDKPCDDSASKKALMKVAAKRAALELQRMDNEKLLAERNEQLYDILERISDGFFSLDKDWNFSYLNSTSAQIFGASWFDLKGQCIWDALPDVASFFFKPLHKAMRTQRSTSIEGFYSAGNVWLVMYVYPSDKGISVYLHDISEQKKFEQEQRELEAQSYRVQKMEVIGQLTAGIAHDFNNTLACIMGYTDLALSDCVDENQGKLKGYLERVYRASERGRDLVLQMLSFSRGGEAAPTPVNPQPPLEDTIIMLQSTLPASIDIIFEKPSEAVPNIAISVVQLQQVVMNLCVNARDAMKGMGRITLRLKAGTSKEVKCHSCHKHQDMVNFVELAISDSGDGIEPHMIEKLFEPFYTTKDVGEGTGLGLFVVHSIIHEYGGHLMVESLSGKGTTFRLFFPAIAVTDCEEVGGHDILIDSSLEKHMGKRILLVDDEEDLLFIMAGMLEAKGFNIDSYSDSRKALTFFKQNYRQIDMVIADLTMPNLGGMELAYELRSLRRDIPIIISSGHSNELNKNNISDYGINGFLPKPYDKKRLLSLVTKVFNSL